MMSEVIPFNKMASLILLQRSSSVCLNDSAIPFNKMASLIFTAVKLQLSLLEW